MKTRIVVVGGLLAMSAALLTGCGLENAVGGPKNVDTVSYEVKDKVAALSVRAGAGDAVITESDGDVIKVVETLKWSDKKPTAEHTVDGDTLRVTYECPSGLISMNCSVDYKIEIPKGVRTELDAGSGDVTLTSLTGPIEVKIGSGDLNGTGIRADEAVVEAGSGDADLKYADTPASVRMKAGSGNVTLHLPGGPYDVRTEVGSGNEDVSVEKDAGSPNKVTMSAGSGDVSVLPR